MMVFRSICFSLAVFFTFSSQLIAKGELHIKYDLSRGMRGKLREEITHVIPHKTQPDPYHVTLFHVHGMPQEDKKELKGRLQAIRKRFKKSAHFTPKAAVRLRSDFLALIPKGSQTAWLQYINDCLYEEFLKFEAEKGKSYTVDKNTHPKHYTPHITIARPDFMEQNRINSQSVLKNVNSELLRYRKRKGDSFEVLHSVRSAHPTNTPKNQMQPSQQKRTLKINRPVAQPTPVIRKAAPLQSSSPSVKSQKVWLPVQRHVAKNPVKIETVIQLETHVKVETPIKVVTVIQTENPVTTTLPTGFITQENETVQQDQKILSSVVEVANDTKKEVVDRVDLAVRTNSEVANDDDLSLDAPLFTIPSKDSSYSWYAKVWDALKTTADIIADAGL